MSKHLITIIFALLLFNGILPAEINTGDTAPNIILRDSENKLIIIKNILKEKPVLISFFFTGCVPCKKEIPELERLNRLYKNKIEIFLIATDKEGSDAVIPYAKSMNIMIKILIDKYSDIAGLYNITKYPTTVIIGKDGKIKYHCAGFKTENISAIESIIKNLR